MNNIKNKKINENYGWLVVIAGFITMVVVYGSVSNSFGIFVVPLTEAFDFSYSSVSAIVSFRALGIIIGAKIAVIVIRKMNVQRCMILFFVVAGVTALIFSRGSNLVHFYICATILGIAEAGTTTLPISILVNNWFNDDKRGFAVSLAYMGSGIGGLILNPVLNNIILSAGWRISYMSIGLLIMCLCIPVVACLAKPSPEKIGARQLGNPFPIEKKDTTVWEYKKAMRSKHFIAIGFIIILAASASTALLIYLDPYLIHSGFLSEQAAFITGVAIGCIAIGKVTIGWIADKVSLVAACCTGFGSLTLSLLLLTILQVSNLLLFPIVIFCGIGMGSITVLMPLLINYFFGEYDFSRIMGQTTMLYGVGIGTGPFLAGMILDLIGSYQVVLPVLAVLSTSAMLVAIISIQKK